MESNNQNNLHDPFGNGTNEREMDTKNQSPGNSWNRTGSFSYGRDNASMRGNDYYGSQGVNSDYGRGNYSNSTFGAGARGDYSGGTRYGEGGSTYGGGSAYGRSRYGSSRSQGGYSANRNSNQSESVQNGYGDPSNLGSRNNYGRQNNGRDYSDFINHNYGNRSSYRSGYDNSIGNYGKTGYGSTRYNNRDKDRESSLYGSANEGTPYKAQPQIRYSENDGRRR